MRRIGLLAGCLVLALVLGGCMTPWGMNMQTQQERKVKESEGTQAVASSDTTYKGPLENRTEVTVGNVGEGAKVDIKPPAPASEPVPTRIDHKQNKAAEAEAEDETEEKTAFWQKNPFTLVLVGAGLLLIVFGLGKLWRLIRNTALGQAGLALDQATRKVITRLRQRMETETDPVKLDALKNAVLEAESDLGGNHA